MWVATEVFQLILQDVHGFKSFDEAKEWFKTYTGVDYDQYLKGLEANDDILNSDYDQTKIFEVDFNVTNDYKAATIEVCFYVSPDIKFRCPECHSLNINGPVIANKCPDCGAEFAVPEITECECKGKNQE